MHKKINFEELKKVSQDSLFNFTIKNKINENFAIFLTYRKISTKIIIENYFCTNTVISKKITAQSYENV